MQPRLEDELKINYGRKYCLNSDTNKGRIVVIDDDKNIQELLETLLSEEGYAVTRFEYFRGMETVLKARPDLIILDVRMPGISGIELSQMLKSHPESKEVPLLGLSAWPEKNMEGLLCEAFVSKPFDVEKLLILIDSLIAR